MFSSTTILEHVVFSTNCLFAACSLNQTRYCKINLLKTKEDRATVRKWTASYNVRRSWAQTVDVCNHALQFCPKNCNSTEKQMKVALTLLLMCRFHLSLSCTDVWVRL